MKTKNIFGILLISSLTVLTACNSATNSEAEVSTDVINDPATAAEEVDESELPIFEFEEKVIEFGEISQGEKVKRRYKFKNVGKTDLIMQRVIEVWSSSPNRGTDLRERHR